MPFEAILILAAVFGIAVAYDVQRIRNMSSAKPTSTSPNGPVPN